MYELLWILVKLEQQQTKLHEKEPLTDVLKVENQGKGPRHGLFLLEAIQANQFIIEYLGSLTFMKQVYICIYFYISGIRFFL